MFELLREQLKFIGRKRVQVYAKGRYPLKRGRKTFYKDGKRGTAVQDVAHYQNDGTDKIKAARFVESAELHNRGWALDLHKMLADIYDQASRGIYSLDPIKRLGEKMAKDISVACNRIDTGRLKRSFTYRILNK